MSPQESKLTIAAVGNEASPQGRTGDTVAETIAGEQGS